MRAIHLLAKPDLRFRHIRRGAAALRSRIRANQRREMPDVWARCSCDHGDGITMLIMNGTDHGD